MIGNVVREITNIHDSKDSRGRERDLYNSSLYHFHPLHRHVDSSWAITAESSPLQQVSSRESLVSKRKSLTTKLRVSLMPLGETSWCICSLITTKLVSSRGTLHVNFMLLLTRQYFNGVFDRRHGCRSMSLLFLLKMVIDCYEQQWPMKILVAVLSVVFCTFWVLINSIITLVTYNVNTKIYTTSANIIENNTI